MSNRVQILKQPLYGSVYWNGVKFVYTPKPGFVGKDSYVYNISNGLTSQTLTNYVNTINAPPSAYDISFGNVDASATLEIDVLNYIVDRDTLVKPLEIKSISTPSQGKAVYRGTTIKYQSNGYNNSDRFSYTVTDGQYESTAFVYLTTINGSNINVPGDTLIQIGNLTRYVNYMQGNSANWETAFRTISTLSGNWNANDATQFIEVFTTVGSNSSKWESSFFNKELYEMAYSVITANSGQWFDFQSNISNLSSIISSNSANWESTYTTVSVHSADWESSAKAFSGFQINYNLSSVVWTDSMNLVQAKSADWSSRAITNIIQYNSGNWDTALSIVTSKSAGWNNATDNSFSFSTVYSGSSANWQTAFDIVQTTSGSWGATTSIELTILTAYSGLWNDAYNIVNGNSAVWSGLSSKYTKYDQAYSVLTGASGNWDVSFTGLCTLSSHYLSAINLISTNSGAWMNGGTTVDMEAHDLTVHHNLVVYGNLTANGTGNQITTQVVDTSAFHIINTGLVDALKVTKTQNIGALAVFERGAASSVPFSVNGSVSSVDTTRATLSCLDYLHTQYTALTSISGIILGLVDVGYQMAGDLPNKDTYYPTFKTLSDQLSSIAYTNVDGVIYYGTNKELILDSTLTVNSLDLNSNSGWTTLIENILTDASMILDDNLWGVTSFDVMRDTALVDLVTQYNTQYNAILNYYYNISDTIMCVNTDNKVGINTRTPGEALTVNGNISASGFIYGQTPSSYTNFTSNSGKYDTTSTYVLNNSASITDMILSANNYKGTLTYLTGASAGISELINKKSLYDSGFSILTSQSGQNLASFMFLTANSATMGATVDTIFRSRYPDYESAYTFYTKATANTIAQINFIFDGSGDIIPANTSGVVQIPSNVKILEWTILANTPTTTQVNIGLADFASYPTYRTISQTNPLSANYPQLVSVIKNRNSSLVGWTTAVSAGDIMKFTVESNSNASLVTVSLKCQKS